MPNVQTANSSLSTANYANVTIDYVIAVIGIYYPNQYFIKMYTLIISNSFWNEL